MTCSESGRCLAEAVVSKFGERVVPQLWGGPAPLLVIPNNSQPSHVCAKFILAGIWLQGRLAAFPAPNRIFINPFMVKKIEQGREGALCVCIYIYIYLIFLIYIYIICMYIYI